MTRQVFTTGEVARIFSASQEAVNVWIRQGKLKAYTTPGGHHRIDYDDLKRFQEDTGMWMDRDLLLDAVPKILVIDDEEHQRGFVARVLEEEYHVATADSGLDGCVKFGAIKPDILIVDLRMPDISGYEVVRIIREKYAAQATKVIVMTAYPLDPEVNKLNMLGIDGFLYKPFGIDDLMRVVYQVEDEAPSRGGDILFKN
jgi:excisionase family DNA binding protein